MPRRGPESPGSKARDAARRVALWYAAVAAVWIVVSDPLVDSLGFPASIHTAIDASKGLLFVAVTAVVLYGLVRRYVTRIFASEERYSRMFANATESITTFQVIRDPAGRVGDLEIADVNPSQSQRLGLPPERLVGMRMSEEGRLGEELEAICRTVREAVASGEPRRAEIRAGGSSLLVSVFAYDADLWAAAGTDITEVRRAQEAIRRQDERIRQAYEDVLDAVTGGKLVLLNDADLDASLGEPILPPQRIDSPRDLGTARERIRDAISSRSTCGDRCEMLNAAGEALNNALKHAGGGTYEVYATDDKVQVEIADTGRGIDFRTLPRATLIPGFSTTATLGMGFTIMLQLADRLLLSTRPGRTRVVLEMDARAREPAHAS